MSKEPLILKDLEPFGVGGRRLCFEYPGDPGKCVKVLRTDPHRTVQFRARTRWKMAVRRPYDNNEDERRQIDKLFSRHGESVKKHFPRHYGFIQTDLGRGLVLDLIRDFDSEISMSLREWITRGKSLDEVREAFQEFRDFLIDKCIFTRAILDHNLVVFRPSEGQYRIVMIDGLGDSTLIPVALMRQKWAEKRIVRKTTEAWRRMQALLEKGGISQDALENSSWGHGIRYNKAINERVKGE